MNKFKNNYIFILIIIFSTSGCGLINNDEKTPNYINIIECKVENPNGEASVSHNIVDIWASTTIQAAGVHTIPADIPILSDDNGTVILEAGIYVNGFINQRQKYFYYKAILDTIINNVLIEPIFQYTSDAIFSENGSDDFEGSVKKFKSLDNNLIKYINNEDSFDNVSAHVNNVVENDITIGLISANGFLIENNKNNVSPTFLEFDYNTSVDMEIGLELEIDGDSDERPHLNLFSSNGEWKHMYADISDDVNFTNLDVKYKIYFKADSSKIDDYITLDNVKVIYTN